MLSVERWIKGHNYVYRCEPADVGRLLKLISRDALDPKHPLTPHEAGVLQEQLFYQEVAGDE